MSRPADLQPTGCDCCGAADAVTTYKGDPLCVDCAIQRVQFEHGGATAALEALSASLDAALGWAHTADVLELVEERIEVHAPPLDARTESLLAMIGSPAPGTLEDLGELVHRDIQERIEGRREEAS